MALENYEVPQTVEDAQEGESSTQELQDDLNAQMNQLWDQTVMLMNDLGLDPDLLDDEDPIWKKIVNKIRNLKLYNYRKTDVEVKNPIEALKNNESFLKATWNIGEKLEEQTLIMSDVLAWSFDVSAKGFDVWPDASQTTHGYLFEKSNLEQVKADVSGSLPFLIGDFTVKYGNARQLVQGESYGTTEEWLATVEKGDIRKDINSVDLAYSSPNFLIGDNWKFTNTITGSGFFMDKSYISNTDVLGDDPNNLFVNTNKQFAVRGGKLWWDLNTSYKNFKLKLEANAWKIQSLMDKTVTQWDKILQQTDETVKLGDIDKFDAWANIAVDKFTFGTKYGYVKDDMVKELMQTWDVTGSYAPTNTDVINFGYANVQTDYYDMVWSPSSTTNKWTIGYTRTIANKDVVSGTWSIALTNENVDAYNFADMTLVFGAKYVDNSINNKFIKYITYKIGGSMWFDDFTPSGIHTWNIWWGIWFGL